MSEGGIKMFRGLHEHTIDSKGRTSFPLRFREILGEITQPATAAESGDKFILTTGIDRCLVAYPLDVWREFEERLAGLSQFDPAVVQLKRIYVAGATECVLDKHGRLMVPPMLREYAGLQKDVVWAGMVNTIELWAKELWSQQIFGNGAERQKIAKALSELGL
jgi:MraZ protein